MAILTTKRYPVREAAQLLGVTVRTLRRWQKAETAPVSIALVPMRIGGRLYYTEELIAEWQRQCDLRRKRLRREI
jgi:DNA-binding transcriptional MerR regulator